MAIYDLPVDADPNIFSGNPNNDPTVKPWEGYRTEAKKYQSSQKKKKSKIGKTSKKAVEKPVVKQDDDKEPAGAMPGKVVTLYRPSRGPYSYRPGDFTHVWIKLTARPIEKQAAWARTDKAPIEKSYREFELNFLAPNEIQEIVSHEWGPYESVASKIAEKAAQLGRFGNEIQNISTQISDYAKRLDQNKALTPQAIAQAKRQGFWNTMQAIGRGLSRADVRQQRVDTALVYKNSERRKYDFVFYLADMGQDDLYDEVVYPVKLLEFLSSPSQDIEGGNKSLADIKAPFYFQLTTWPIDYIKVKYAACTLVQPTWKGPYVGGVPTQCELHLSFTEIEPLWDSMFIDDVRITTSTRLGRKQVSPSVDRSKSIANVERELGG